MHCADITEPVFQPELMREYTVSYNKYRCGYNPFFTQTCRMDAETVTADTVTTSHSQGFAASLKVGYVYKGKPPLTEYNVEVTVDASYSFTSATVSAYGGPPAVVACSCSTS